MINRVIRQLWLDERAGTLTVTAVIFPMLLGFAGLGMDVTGWYMQKRDAQNLADMAAIEAAHTGHYYSDGDLTNLVADFMQSYGMNTSTDTLTVNSPPTSGDYAGDNRFKEIVVQRNVTLNFLSAFYGLTGGNLNVEVGARAVAGTVVIGTQCIVALDESADRALDFSGTATVVAECGVAANSTSDEAIYVGGNASLTADPAMAVGDISISGSATLTTNSPLQTFAEATEDPYSGLSVPPVSSCDVTVDTTIGDDAVMTPGRYCGDITVQGENITFQPGTYIIDGGDFKSNANSQFSGSGVTFILTGSTPSDIGTVSMNGSSSATLSAPSTGDYAGVVFFQDSNADYRGTNALFNGGSDLLFDGVIYFPSSDVTFSGGSSANPSCMQIFAATVEFTANSHIGNDEATCTSLNMGSSAQERVQLVE